MTVTATTTTTIVFLEVPTQPDRYIKNGEPCSSDFQENNNNNNNNDNNSNKNNNSNNNNNNKDCISKCPNTT